MSVGEALASARASAGMTVEQVSERTCIRSTLIRAIESDDYSLCGGLFYARGHIRTIARVVGIDPVPLLDEFDRAHAEPSAPLTEGTILEVESKAKPERTGPRWGVAMVASVLLAVCLVAGYSILHGLSTNSGVSGTGSNSVADQPSPTRTTTGHTGRVPPTGTHTSASSPATRHSTTAAAPPNAVAYNTSDGVMLRVRVVGDRSWISVSDSTGHTLFQGTLEHGATRDFRDAKQLGLVVGAPAATDLVVNGQDLGLAGPADKVVHRTFVPGDPTSAAKG